MYMPVFIILCMALITLTLFFLSFGYICFRRACRRSKRRDPAARGLVRTERYGEYAAVMEAALALYEKEKKEEVCALSFDSLRLCATYIEAQNNNGKLIIAFHGYRSCAAADFAPIYRAFLDEGYSLLLPYQRSHGKSEGKYIGLGALERKEVLCWCEYAKERFGENVKIYLYGISMGASTVTFASCDAPPSQVKATVADCGFTSPFDIIKNTLAHKNKIPPFPVIYFMNFWSRILAGFDFNEISALKAAKHASVPILLIHGAKDTYVPTDMSCAIHARSDKKTELALFENATHARSHLAHTEKYISTVLAFLKNK